MLTLLHHITPCKILSENPRIPDESITVKFKFWPLPFNASKYNQMRNYRGIIVHEKTQMYRAYIRTFSCIVIKAICSKYSSVVHEFYFRTPTSRYRRLNTVCRYIRQFPCLMLNNNAYSLSAKTGSLSLSYIWQQNKELPHNITSYVMNWMKTYYIMEK